MGTSLFSETIPSKIRETLSSLIGTKLERLTRFSWNSVEDAMQEYGLSEREVFSFTAGPVLLYFDSGLVLGASSNPAINSIVLWVERNEAGDTIVEPTESDDELFPLEASEQTNVWSDLIGKRIKSYKIIKRTSSSAKLEDLPNEVGLILEMENGESFILSHGLHDNSDDFSVIQNEQITEVVSKEIKIV